MISELTSLTICTGLTAALVVAELVLGHFSHCLTLLTLTNQMIYNLLTLIFTTAAKKLNSDGESLKSTFGWARLEVVGTLFSLVFLGSLSFATAIECLQTLFHNEHLDEMHHSFSICILAGCHFVIWIIVFFLIGGYSHMQNSLIAHKKSDDSVALLMPTSKLMEHFVPFNFKQIVKVPFKDIFRDLSVCFFLLLSAALGFISSTVVEIPYFKYVDPVVALISILIMVLSNINISKEASLILLQTIPATLDVHELKSELFQKFPAILNIHEMHIWCLVPGNIVVTMHVIFSTKESYKESLTDIQQYLCGRGISKFTIQPEICSPETGNDDKIMAEHHCLLRCKRGKANCINCCKVPAK